MAFLHDRDESGSPASRAMRFLVSFTGFVLFIWRLNISCYPMETPLSNRLTLGFLFPYDSLNKCS
jgi:hypothetical protein